MGKKIAAKETTDNSSSLGEITKTTSGNKQLLDASIGNSMAPYPNTSGSASSHANGTATTTPASIPSVAGNAITSILVNNTNTTNVSLLMSLDGGVTTFTIPAGYHYTGEPKGVTQIQLSTASGTCTYEVIMDVLT